MAEPAKKSDGNIGIKLRSYEEAVASLLLRGDTEHKGSTNLPEFPPRLVPLPPSPDVNNIHQINSVVPKVSTEIPANICAACKKKKVTKRLAEKRKAKKQRAEAEKDGIVQPPCWPFTILPPAACPRGGGRLSGRRARKKEGQLSSMIRCVLAMLPDDAFGPLDTDGTSTPKYRMRIVDFAGGSGHLALPLALLLPRCQVVIVDLKDRSLEVARDRAGQCGGNVTNLETFHGSIATYTDSFDVGTALHACGEATDLALNVCGKGNAAFVVAPCCVGKLTGFNPYIFAASNGESNIPLMEFPQSVFYRQCLDFSASDFDALAKAADHAEYEGDKVNAIKRSAKLLLEFDRLAAIVEQYAYYSDHVGITRMEPLDSSPKNDILFGWPASSSTIRSPYRAGAAQSMLDPYILEARQQLSNDGNFCIDGTAEEEEEIRSKLMDVFGLEGLQSRKKKKSICDANGIFRFPTGMGSRQRRLVHYVAESLGLAHWGEGKRGNEKIVCVAQRNTGTT